MSMVTKVGLDETRRVGGPAVNQNIRVTSNNEEVTDHHWGTPRRGCMTWRGGPGEKGDRFQLLQKRLDLLMCSHYSSLSGVPRKVEDIVLPQCATIFSLGGALAGPKIISSLTRSLEYGLAIRSVHSSMPRCYMTSKKRGSCPWPPMSVLVIA